MSRYILSTGLLVIIAASCLAGTSSQTQLGKARSRMSDLRFGSHATSQQVEQLAIDTFIVKYPQWYDRFHLFGYDTQTLPRLFDQVWVQEARRARPSP